MPKINNSTMKENNIRMILNVIRKKGAVSRADLAKELHLTSPAVTIIVTDLLRRNILTEIGTDRASVGRKPILLDINREAVYVMGVAISMEEIVVSIGDFKANVICQEKVPVNPLLGKDVIIEKILSGIKAVMEEKSLMAGEILAIGIAAPGPVDTKNGVIVCPPNLPDWKNVPITEIVSEATGIPCVLDKDTNAAALAEYYRYAFDGDPIFYLLVMPDSFGGCVLSDGKIMHGYKDGSGDIGHTVIDMNGPRCACGQYGCLEAVASGKALLKKAREMMGTFEQKQGENRMDRESLKLSDLFAEENQEIPLFSCVTDYAARAVATALGNVISIVSPAAVIVGGTHPGIDGVFVEKIREYLKQRSYPFAQPDMQIILSETGKECMAAGSLVLALDAFQTTLCMQPFPEKEDGTR